MRWLLAMSLGLLALAGQAAAGRPESIRVVMDDNYPPYVLRDSQGQPEGYLIDLWHLWESKTGVRVELTATDWARARAIMAAGEADVIDTIFRTPERERQLDFTPPYETIRVGIFTDAGIGAITRKESLRGFLVGAKAGDNCIDELKAAGVTSIAPYDNYEKLVAAAVDGHIKAFCLDEPPATYLLYRAQAFEAFRKAFTLYSGEFHRAVHKGDVATLALLAEGFKAITPGEYKALHDKWMGHELFPFPWGRYLVYGLAAAAVAGLGLLLWTVSLRRQVSRHTRLLSQERSRLHAVVHTIPDLIWLKDPDGIYLACNPEFELFFGAAEADILGKRDHDFVPAELADFFRQKDLEAIAAGRPSINEEWITYATDGRRVLLETIKTPMRDEAGQLTGVLGIARDITALRQAEQSLRKINRAQRLLSDANHAVLREQDEVGLLESICKVAVEAGGYLLAWVGFAEDDADRTVRVVARAGVDSGYLDSARISWGDTPAGRGPSGIAIRSGQPAINQNILDNPAMSPWREAALQRGYQSSIALPLVIGGRAIGSLSIYAAEPDAFQAEEVALLTELAGDLAFGLEALRTRLAHADAEAALRESEFLFRSQFDLGNIGIALSSPSKNWLRVNPHLCEMLGYSEEELRMRTWEDITHPEDLAASRERFQRLLDGEIDSYDLDKRYLRGDGEVLHAHLSVACYRAKGAVSLIISSVLDITERRRNEEKLALAAQVFENTIEGVMITDTAGCIVAVNKAFTDITGYAPEEVHGQRPSLLKSDRHDADFYAQMWASITATGTWRGEIWNRRKNGETYPEWLTISAVPTSTGTASRYVAVFSDISEIKTSQERLNFLAYHDPLTGLPNRLLFRDRLEHGIERARRSGSLLAVLYLDLDHFKHINDSLGHHVGDEVLRQAALRLAEHCRRGDTVARLGGDEFVVILEGETSAQSVASVAHKLGQVFAKPLQVGGRETFITPSIGLSLFPTDGLDPDTLLKQADLAMYKAKQRGRNTFQFFEATLSAQALERMNMENALRGAIDRREFLLHFQPQVSLVDGGLVGVEALVRWQHPELGLVAPGRFIPVAEEMGLIGKIGDWVLEAACRQLAGWREQGFIVPRLAVNLSVQQLEREDLASRVRQLLQRWSIAASRLELEVTESMLMGHSGHSARVLEGLRALGVYLAVDDFGTGYSSLGYLQKLPVHRLKIDRSFIRDIGTSRNNEAIIHAVTALATNLELELVAEGVEEEAQADFLRHCGCPIAQGYLYGRPMPAEALMAAWQDVAQRS